MRKFIAAGSFYFNVRFILLFLTFILISEVSTFAQNKNDSTDSSAVIPDTLLFRLEKYQAAITRYERCQQKRLRWRQNQGFTSKYKGKCITDRFRDAGRQNNSGF